MKELLQLLSGGKTHTCKICNQTYDHVCIRYPDGHCETIAQIG